MRAIWRHIQTCKDSKDLFFINIFSVTTGYTPAKWESTKRKEILDPENGGSKFGKEV